MMRVLRTFILLNALAFSPAALACWAPETPTFRQELAEAKHVFIFQLTSLELVQPGNSLRVTGKFALQRTLKGDGKRFRYFQYTAYPCHGLRLIVGNYYIVATSQNGAVLDLARGDRSIMDLRDHFSSSNRDRIRTMQWHVANYLKGVPLPDSFRDEEGTYSTSGISGPPPPRPPEFE